MNSVVCNYHSNIIPIIFVVMVVMCALRRAAGLQNFGTLLFAHPRHQSFCVFILENYLSVKKCPH